MVLPLARPVDAVLAEARHQRAARDPEQLGGAGLVTGALLERGEAPCALGLVCRPVGRAGSVACYDDPRGLRNVEREIVGGDRAAGAGEEGGALDGVLELADVARPVVGGERGEGRGGDRSA